MRRFAFLCLAFLPLLPAQAASAADGLLRPAQYVDPCRDGRVSDGKAAVARRSNAGCVTVTAARIAARDGTNVMIPAPMGASATAGPAPAGSCGAGSTIPTCRTGTDKYSVTETTALAFRRFFRHRPARQLASGWGLNGRFMADEAVNRGFPRLPVSPLFRESGLSSLSL